MHILGINGSMRKGRHTETMVNAVISGIREHYPDLTSRIIQVSELNVSPCRVTCQDFCRSHPYQCCVQDDVSSVVEQIENCDALVMGSPLYFRGPPAQFQALCERIIARFFALEEIGARKEESGFSVKPCGLVGVAEYTNPLQVLEYLNDFAGLLGLNVVKVPRLPYLGAGGQGDITKDLIFQPFERCRELAEGLASAVKEKT